MGKVDRRVVVTPTRPLIGAYQYDPANLARLGCRHSIGIEAGAQYTRDALDLLLLAADQMPDARHHDFARVDVVRFRFRGIHLQLTHRRSARRGADVQAVSAVWCRISGLQQLPDRDGRTYMMPGKIGKARV